MEILATIARSYKKILYGLYGTIYGSWIWLPRKVNPGIYGNWVGLRYMTIKLDYWGLRFFLGYFKWGYVKFLYDLKY